MTGDEADIRARIRLTLPTRWFGDTTPILDGVMSGLAASWSALYEMLMFVRLQSRLSSATDQFLDLAAVDFVSSPLPRRSQETDDDFRRRLISAMKRKGATKQSLIEAARSSGYELDLFEAAQPQSTGAYNTADALAWNAAGGWGSIAMPLECLAVARPGPVAYESELWANLASAAPAGGAVWLRVDGTKQSVLT